MEPISWCGRQIKKEGNAKSGDRVIHHNTPGVIYHCVLRRDVQPRAKPRARSVTGALLPWTGWRFHGDVSADRVEIIPGQQTVVQRPWGRSCWGGPLWSPVSSGAQGARRRKWGEEDRSPGLVGPW